VPGFWRRHQSSVRYGVQKSTQLSAEDSARLINVDLAGSAKQAAFDDDKLDYPDATEHSEQRHHRGNGEDQLRHLFSRVDAMADKLAEFERSLDQRQRDLEEFEVGDSELRRPLKAARRDPEETNTLVSRAEVDEAGRDCVVADPKLPRSSAEDDTKEHPLVREESRILEHLADDSTHDDTGRPEPDNAKASSEEEVCFGPPLPRIW
jgi:hypothetical protein